MSSNECASTTFDLDPQAWEVLWICIVSFKRRTGERRGGRPRPMQRAPTALLVDDAFDCRDMYGEMLRYGGYTVLEAVDGADALAVALGQHPDIIVMDLCMPRMDGWEAIRRLKSDSRTRAIPVIALTALEWHASAADAGCEAYLIKPCLPLDLLGVVDSLLARTPHT
jgi:two-component system cell cycle response regulator DivK